MGFFELRPPPVPYGEAMLDEEEGVTGSAAGLRTGGFLLLMLVVVLTEMTLFGS